ncbi:MAG: hypothetical protein P8X89_18935 [Reinekea sp.]
MSGPNEAQSTSPSAFELKLSWTSRQLALAGGYLMLGLAMMTVISIIGRTFFAKPVSGDYELVQIGLAISGKNNDSGTALLGSLFMRYGYDVTHCVE